MFARRVRHLVATHALDRLDVQDSFSSVAKPGYVDRIDGSE